MIHETGEAPPDPARGAVIPPPTCAEGIAAWICAYAGFSSFCTYVAALVGCSHWARFGSFQIVHRRTQRYRVAAARAKSPNAAPDLGAQFGPRPPFAQRGVP